MGDLQIIEVTLAKAARRRRNERALRGLWRGLLVGAVIVLLTLGVYKLAPIPRWTLGAAAGLGVVAALVGLIAGGWHKTSLTETARWVDGRQHLQERLSSALELAGGSGAETWRTLLVNDATEHAKGLDVRRLVQIKFPKTGRWALVLLVLTAGLGFVPEYRSKNFQQAKSDQKIIKEAGKQLTELTKRNLAKRPPALETTQKAMDAVGELGEHLTKQALTRNEALKDLAKVTDQIKDEVRELNKDPAMKRLEQAARSPGGENSPDAARLQKQIAEAQKQLGNPTGTPEDMDKLNKELNKIQEAAKTAGKDGNMSQADKEKISKAMAALSKDAQEMGMQMPNLDQAIEALAANQTDLFLKDLQAQTLDLEKTRDMAKSLQQMQQQMEKMGKDLAEQLKNGQPEAAQDTLKKMMEQLKASQLTPDQLNKMLAEISKAVDPASKYGKVGEHLKEAAQKLQAGQKPGASQSLAKASQELDKLMQQMNDAQAMQAELEALNAASQSVGTGQQWGQGKGNKPGPGDGGKPGKGVGTWADEKSWGYDGQFTEHWDNSGIVRPDQKARGITDRGDTELNDALKPTKVKGQFTPGGQMPSITLKGVSIKGQSKVAYEEAAVAAQADAQSALSQEKVPRAYQGAVRDYFDDLKK